ncbi:MAG: hypothetical protein D6737_04880 [Chloroflexi bacterium]|nr:MAG: hypothetical protein D6737_04880 [Chloroflexota bacterium]
MRNYRMRLMLMMQAFWRSFVRSGGACLAVIVNHYHAVGAQHIVSLLVFSFIIMTIIAPTQAQDDFDSIVYGLTLEPSGIDPHINRSSELGIPLRMVYDTLVYRHPETGEFVPGLASSWQISDDGRVYTFTLRQDVTFHDGVPFNAQAVAANLDRITAEETGSQLARFLLGPFSEYAIIDDFTIQLILSEPFSPLLDSLSQVYLGMASPAAIQAHPGAEYQFAQVGSGPYRFVEYRLGERIVIERYDDYAWGPTFYQPPEDPIDEIVFRFFTDEANRTLALEAGEATVMGELPPLDASFLVDEFDILQARVPGQPTQFMMNVERFPTDDLAVRQALILSANRGLITGVVFQDFSPIAWGPISSNTQFYDESMQGRYTFNPEAAATLLDDAGYIDTDDDGVRERDGRRLAVNVIVPPWGLLPEVAQILRNNWEPLGIQVDLVLTPSFGLLLGEVDKGEYNLVAFNAFGVDPQFLSQFYRSDATNNWMNVDDAELDALLDAAQQATDDAERARLYAQIQQMIMDEALMLPIREHVNINGADRTIENLTFDRYGWFPLLVNASLRDG